MIRACSSRLVRYRMTLFSDRVLGVGGAFFQSAKPL